MNVLAEIALFPERASNHAVAVDAIFYGLLVLCGLITLGITAAILFACIRYRRGSNAPKRGRKGVSLYLELAWTGATLLAFVAIFAWAAVVYVRMSTPPANASEIHIVARQWMWKAQHANGRREIDELHLPVGVPVKLIMTSQDVIHDLFIPAFRTKQDVVPGRYTSEWFIPTKPGRYHLYCAEYCGLDHSRMGGWVYVMESHDFSRWLANASSSESVIATGQRLFISRGCSGCHSANSVVRAPLLEGLYRRSVALAGGETVLADDQYLHDSILLPNKQITAGFEPLMPTYQGQLQEEEVMSLVSYLKSLTLPMP